MQTWSSPFATLAEILTSRHVGLTHVRLVGEVIVAQTRLDEVMFARRASVSPEARLEAAERVLTCEDAVGAAWLQVVEAADTRNPVPLRSLESSLADAARTYESLRRDVEGGPSGDGFEQPRP